MKKLLLSLMLASIFLGCSPSNNANSQNSQSIANQNIQSSQLAQNNIVFRDSKGNILNQSQRDSLVSTLSVQTLRTINKETGNTEYILFEQYEDLRGYIPDSVIDNLMEEATILRTQGRGALLQKRVSDDWLNKELPNGEIVSLDGSIKELNSFKDNLLVLNFWYINCGPCIEEMPDLNQLVKDYEDQPINFLALTFDTVEDVKNLLLSTAFNYQIGSIPREFMFQFSPVAPTHFIVDKQGVVKEILVGAYPDIKQRLKDLIEKNKN
jgi:thiol-disulfide isomerase/thioredoxin